MRKYFTCLLLFLWMPISCSNRNQELEKFQINSAEISAAIVEIDSVVNSLKSEGKLQFLDKEVLEPADMAWNKFKQLCNSQKYKEAYEFYKRDQGDILVSLSHSSSRYTFLAEVLKPLMTQYETPDSMAVKYLEAIELEYQLQSATIKLSGEESYVPEVYPFTIIEYGRALNKVGRQGEATNLVEELKDATLFLTEDAMDANFTTTIYLAYLLDDSGDSEAAVNLFKLFKNDVLMWKSEDAGQEGAEEYYNDYLRMIDDRIEQFSN